MHYRELLSSLHRLLLFLITGDIATHLPQAPSFAQQLLDLAQEDTGHLIASTSALIFALRAHRTSLAIAGVFGAGKTLTFTYLLAWLSLSTIHTRIAVLFRENPAGEAIAQNVDNLYLKQLMVRPVARDHYLPGRFTIDHPSNKCTHAISKATVVLCTTGTAYQNAQSPHPCIASYLQRCNILVLEEAQQLGEHKGTYAQSLTRSDCLHVLTGDDKQSQGGLAAGVDAEVVRDRITESNIGLRGQHRWFTPGTLALTLVQGTEPNKERNLDLIYRQAAAVQNTALTRPWKTTGPARLLPQAMTVPDLQEVRNLPAMPHNRPPANPLPTAHFCHRSRSCPLSSLNC
eukprot:Skav232017  [mRNA]  locus=scaffold3320:112117:113151:+ [translate_table: standard]